MSTDKDQTQAAVTDRELNDEQVRAYLMDNGDFLQRNPDLLDHLHISHATGSAVSLVEKQVSVLRERNVEMRHRLTSLTANARDNDKLYAQTRLLLLKLLEAGDREQLYTTFITAMRDDFRVEYASMILFGEPGSAGDARVDRAETAAAEIGSLLRGNNPVCGVLRKEELNYLLPDAGAVGSAALMPMVAEAETVGLLAVGSADANKFSSDMGTLFLAHIAEVIVRLLQRL